jgi:hypothetical protein
MRRYTATMGVNAACDGPLRQMLLALVFLGAAGLLVELGLLEHFDSVTQWIPLALLVVVLGATGAVYVRRGPGTVRFFQGVMALCVVTGVIGVYLHYREAIRGATPALAPGALSQLGLLGLAYAFRHPALRAPITSLSEES